MENKFIKVSWNKAVWNEVVKATKLFFEPLFWIKNLFKK